MLKMFFAVALRVIISGCSRVNQSQILAESAIAEVTKVEATGKANNYTFSVTIDSPDTGCNSYADWWEVITPDGELIYRRVLLHSHVDEQPFTRTGDAVAIQPQDEVIVRVHMSSEGYSQQAQQGSIQSGFTTVTLPQDLANNLELVEPLPESCAF